jgi:ribose/xylose/arabinose/galactoside ABC-type transport system permease subunit
MVHVQPQLVQIATGVVIVAAVALERWRRRGG